MAEEKPKGRSLSTRSIVWIVMTLLFGLFGLVTVLAPPEGAESVVRGFVGFDLQGHRGARGLAPENSLPGMETALAVGVTTLELDVVMSADGVLLVHHDRRLDPDRTRGPGGGWLDPEAEQPAIIELPAAALAVYDVGRLKPETRVATRFPDQVGRDGVAIPRLSAVVAKAEAISGGTIRYNIETKISPLDPGSSADPKVIAEALVALIREAGVTERAAVQSFDWRSLAAVHELAPEIVTVYLTAEQSWLDTVERGRPGASPWLAELDVDKAEGSLPRLIEAAGGRVWSPFYRDLRKPALAEAHRFGLRVVVWTVNEPADMASLIELGVDGIITDYPDRLRRVMKEKGLPLPKAYPQAAE